MENLSSVVKGRIGELLAAAAIEQCGWHTLLTPMDHIDLVAMRGSKFMRVQVKSANSRPRGNKVMFGYMTRTNHNEVLNSDYIDIVAFVALNLRRVLFFRPIELPKSFRLSYESFDNIDNERTSWETAVNNVLGT